jgi:hypothetical protein
MEQAQTQSQNGQRQGQRFLGLKLSEDLADAMYKGLKGRDKSQFAREAIAEKLAKLGIVVKEESVLPPSREGKGGPKYKKSRGKNKEPKK